MILRAYYQKHAASNQRKAINMSLTKQIARIEVGMACCNGNQPHVEFRTGYIGAPTLSVSDNGYQVTTTQLDVEMFDALKQLVNDHRVVEHYENLRNQNDD